MLPELKSREDYVDDYLDKYNELNARDALWRLRVQPQEFLDELDRILERSRRDRTFGSKNEYAIRSDEKGSVAVLLMDRMTDEESRAQFQRNRELAKTFFAEEAPRIQENVSQWTLPIKRAQYSMLLRYLLREQISLEQIPAEVLEEFKKSREYEAYTRRRSGH